MIYIHTGTGRYAAASGFWLHSFTSVVSPASCSHAPIQYIPFLHFILPECPSSQVFSLARGHRRPHLFHASLANKYFNGRGTSDMASFLTELLCVMCCSTPAQKKQAFEHPARV